MSLPTQTPRFHFAVAILSLLFGAWGVVAESVITPRQGTGVPFAHSRPGPVSYSSASTKRPISGSSLRSFGSSPGSGCSEGTTASPRFPPKNARDIAAWRSASDDAIDPSEILGGVVGAPYESGLLGSVLTRRANSTASNVTSSNLAAYGVGELSYAVQISLGGQNYTVQLDTGSSDLWLYTSGLPVQLTNSTGLMTSETYGDDDDDFHVQGSIEFAELKMGDFTIESQVFLNATAVPEGFDSTTFDGMMGMAFDVGAVYGAVQQAWGTDAADRLALSPMSSLFAQSPSNPHNFDILLDRQPELASVGRGVLLISEHAEGFDDPASPPQLPRVGSEHWSVVMDAMKINGQTFSFNSSVVPGVPSGSTVAVLDSGSSFPGLPPAAVDAIYGSVPGALFDETSQNWFLPCNSSTNLTFVFGGEEFPVHPLDLTYPLPVTLSVNGWDTTVTLCVNAYRYLTSEPTASNGFDIILGDEFLRNVYTSFNYADWTPSNNATSTPFVQMVSITNTTSMWDDFWTTRTTTLSQLPLALDPSSISYYSAGSTGASPNNTATEARLSGSQDSDLSGTPSDDAATTSSNDDAASWVNQYGKVVLGLLIASFVLNVVLLATMLLEVYRARRASARYAQLRQNDRMEEYGRGPLVQPAASEA